MTSSPLTNWLPYKIIPQHDQVLCRWLYAGDKPFTEPFFDETVAKCLGHPFNSSRYKCVGNIELLPQWSEELEVIKPAAFIFHISRCGSTLLSQLLGIPDENVVLPEVPFLDDLIRYPYKYPGFPALPVERLFAAALCFYGQKRKAKQKHLFVKTDSWHILFYEQLRKCYPSTPFVLLYRTPGEVIRSHRKKRGMHSVPGIIEPEVFGFDRETVKGMDMDQYTARVLETYFAAYLDVMKKDALSILVNYDEGMVAIAKKLAERCGIIIPEGDLEKMKDRAGFDAKYPDKAFTIEPPLMEVPAWQQHSNELYRQVEVVRLSGR